MCRRRELFDEELSDQFGLRILSVHDPDDNYRIEHDLFKLKFWIGDESFIIDHLSTANPRKGHGRKVVTAAKSVSDECGLLLKAENVLPEAISFWRKMGLCQHIGRQYVYNPHTGLMRCYA
ncbi:MAG: hypothetical protein AAB388_02705 [Patescibacteria group bacterium]